MEVCCIDPQVEVELCKSCSRVKGYSFLRPQARNSLLSSVVPVFKMFIVNMKERCITPSTL